MTDRQKNVLWLTGLFILLVLFYSKILFTGKIIRAPDIINESYWGVIEAKKLGWQEIFSFIKNVKAGWNIEINSGFTTEGGNTAVHLLLHLKAITFLIPAPACVAWTIVLSFYLGACGLYLYCRTINCSRVASFFAALIFALSPEMASLINAGHVMKIATISYATWAFFCLEKGFVTRRIFWFLAASFVLAFQFFNTHWQIAYYTCLAVGLYGIIRLMLIWFSSKGQTDIQFKQLVSYNLILLLFFLSTVAIALVPLANWSKDTNRGVNSGANQGKGGLDREEAMMWSLPPEETAALVIPGLFGYSRQEAGANPSNIPSYYWGRMVMTQTVSYMGLLPWLLVPLPLLFRRDKYTWLAVIGLAGGLLFSMGKYTPFYNLLYDYFPGINRFRVPKMMMFISVITLGVLAARGIDLLMDMDIRAKRSFRWYLAGVVALPVLLLLFLGVLQFGKSTWIEMFIDRLAQPTRYEQGAQLITQRWNNLMLETGITTFLAALLAGVLVFWRRNKTSSMLLPCVLIILYLGDVWRVNDKFMFLVDAPEKGRATQNALMTYLAQGSNQYRTLPMDGSDPMHYVSNKIPVMFTANAVQQRRWQEYLDNFNLNSNMPDILNVKYLVFSNEQYAKEQSQLNGKFVPVFQSPGGQQLVLENREVLPKAWLVPSAVKVDTPEQILQMLQSAIFKPAQTALVESPPPIKLDQPFAGSLGDVRVERYEGEHIEVTATTKANSLLVLGDKFYKGWKATVDGVETTIYPVDYILRGVYLTPGTHKIEFRFDPLPFKIGKWLTLSSFAFFAVMLGREIRYWRRKDREGRIGDEQTDLT
jgi:hypothetical protein